MLFLTYKIDIVNNSLPSYPSFVYPESVNKISLDASLSPAISVILSSLREFFAGRRIESYIVGGMVRDMVMGRPTADADIAIGGNAIAIGQDIAEMLGAHCVVLDSENNVVRLLPQKDKESQDWQIDIASLQGNLAGDLGRRDFTIDAMAIDLAKAILTQDRIQADVIDPSGGLDDIDKKLISATSPQVFQQDAIRLLRGIRIGADLGFAIEQQTSNLMQQDHDLIRVVAGERVREELLKIFALTGTYKTIVLMDELGLLMAVFPEMEPSRNFDQAKEHHWDVLYHSLRSIEATDFILHRDTWKFADNSVISGMPWDKSIEDYFEAKVSPLSSRRTLTKLAALLHDIAKPQTKIINEAGRIRFYGHPQEGAPIAAAILERLRFSNREIKFIETIVRYHLRPVQMNENGAPPTPRAIYRYFRDLEEAAIATLYFSLADHLAARGPNLDMEDWEWHVEIARLLVAEYQKTPPPASLPPLLDGHDLQHELGIAPGRRLGELLEELREAQAAGEITTRGEALVYVKKILSEGKH
jgi:poly(A) polymerase